MSETKATWRLMSYLACNFKANLNYISDAVHDHDTEP
jgi:hypothetical protein